MPMGKPSAPASSSRIATRLAAPGRKTNSKTRKRGLQMLEVTAKRKPMYSRTVVLLVAFVAALGWWASPAPADLLDKKTFMTFSARVEIRGRALPAGTYVFKLLNATSNRNIVQVFDKDEQH